MVKKFSGILLFFILLYANVFAQQQNKSVFNIPVTFSISEMPLANVLDKISDEINVYFSYDASVVVSERLVSLNIVNQPVIEALCSLFDNNLFFFTEKENQIIISLIENSNEQKLTSSQNIENNNFVSISGKLTDEKKDIPLIFASVSVFNKPIGTITNTEGEYILKINTENINDTLVLSCLGYTQKLITVKELLKNETISLHPISIQIKEVKVTAITPEELLNNVVANIDNNYGRDLIMMKAFYRETLKQDNKFINISEAVVEVLKSQYFNSARNDKVRIIKGRKSPYVSPFHWVDFKLMGGPLTMTQLDVLKTMDSFIDPEFRSLYDYKISEVIWFHEHPVYVLQFSPLKYNTFPCYKGEMYIDRETFAVLHAEFGFSKKGLRIAEHSLIRKKPRGIKVRPVDIKYTIDYRYNNGICYFNSARASLVFKVRSRDANINSRFYSVSELLVTDHKKSQIKRFPRNQIFHESDIFTENIQSFDKDYWGNFNILKPEKDLRSAIEDLKNINESNDYKPFINKRYLTDSETEKQ